MELNGIVKQTTFQIWSKSKLISLPTFEITEAIKRKVF